MVQRLPAGGGLGKPPPDKELYKPRRHRGYELKNSVSLWLIDFRVAGILPGRGPGWFPARVPSGPGHHPP